MATPSVGFTQTTTEATDPRHSHALHQKKESEACISIIAKIENLDAWKALANVKTRAIITERGGWIVTALIPTDQFTQLQKLPFVTSMKLGETLRSYFS